MARPTKDSKALNINLDSEVCKNLEDFIKETGLTKTTTVEKALTEYINKYKKTGKL